MYLLVFDSMCFFCIPYEKKSVAILHDTRPALAAAGKLMSEAGQLVLVESDLPYLYS
jgi:hypothetical protein